MNEIVDYMIRQYKEKRHIPTYDELTEKFPRASWSTIVDSSYTFDAWHTVWTSERV